MVPWPTPSLEALEVFQRLELAGFVGAHDQLGAGDGVWLAEVEDLAPLLVHRDLVQRDVVLAALQAGEDAAPFGGDEFRLDRQFGGQQFAQFGLEAGELAALLEVERRIGALQGDAQGAALVDVVEQLGMGQRSGQGYQHQQAGQKSHVVLLGWE